MSAPRPAGAGRPPRGSRKVAEPHFLETSQRDSNAAVTARPASLLQTMRAVGWSFFGIRRAAGYEEDVQRLNPVHVVIAGVFGAALFVLALVLLVRWVVGSGAALG